MEKSSTTRPFPTNLRQIAQQRLGIHWSDEHESVYLVRLLRCACRCAACVEEWTGKNLLDAQSVPQNIYPQRIEPVGNYALRFHWSDGHQSGIYTHEYLRSLCQCSSCQKPG